MSVRLTGWRSRISIGVAVLALVAAIALLATWMVRGDSDSTGPPADVLATLALLQGDSESQRRALHPAWVELLDEEGIDEPMFPVGARLELDDDAWRSEIEGHGGATGRLVSADGGSAPVEIGLSFEDGAWRVTYIAEVE